MNRRVVLALIASFTALVAACGTTAPTSDASSSTSAAATASPSSSQHVFEADHFAKGAIVGDVTTEDCTLSSGRTTTCARVTIAGYPSTYSAGPFCPATITTSAQDAGIWFDGNGVYDLDGVFVKNLAEFYSDPEWKLYKSDGSVNVTDTQAAFNGAARPDVDPQYQNYCVEGQLAWLPDGKPIQSSVLIPTTPVKAAGASSAQPGSFGITLDGVVIAESAPVNAILGAHTIAAFDDCGGHYNPMAGYHLHGVTGCGELDSEGLVDGETAMFGYAMDGYPIHLPLEGDAVTAANLDACNGHTTEGEGYHYHANDPAKNAVLPCLTGEFVATGGLGGPAGPGQGPPPGGEQNAGVQPGGGLDLNPIAATLGVTVHELEDAMATGNIEDAARMLGTTPAEMAKKLGVSVADIESVLKSQSVSTPTPSASR